MNDRTVLALIIAMTLASGSYAYAQGNSARNAPGRDEQVERQDARDASPNLGDRSGDNRQPGRDERR